MAENDMITLEELKTSFSLVFKNEFNIHSFLSPFLSNSIMIFQMYYYSDMSDIQEKYFGFFMGYIVYKLVQLLTSYYQSSYFPKIQDHYINRKYLDMNTSFKICLFMSLIIHIISYFPLKWLVMFIFTNTYLKKQNPDFVGGSIAKVSQYITIHFWAVFFGIFSASLTNILSLLSYNKYITYGNILRFCFNVVFGIIYRNKYGDDYFVKGLSYADVFGELCTAIFLIFVQYIINPLSQNFFSTMNIDIIKDAIKPVIEIIKFSEFTFYFLINFYDEIFMLLFVYFFVQKYDVTWYNFFFICFIFKNMFYKIPRNDTLAMSMFLKKIRNEPSENLNLNLMPNNYDFDTKAQTNKKYEWMLFIKTKVTNILTLNIVMSIVYIFFYFLKGFFIVKIFKSNIIVIFLFSLNAIIEQLALFIQNIEKSISNKNQSFYLMCIGTLISVLAFIMMFWLTHSISGVTFVIYFTYFFIFFRLYSWTKNCDIMYINMNRKMIGEKREDTDNGDNDDNSNSSFNRILINDTQ